MLRSSFFYILLLAALICGAATCERPIELDIELPEPRLVVNGNFQPGELLQITVSRSQYVLDDDPETDYIAQALVEVTEDGGPTERLRFVPLSERQYNYPYYETRGLRPQIGKSYTLRVKVPDSEFEEVSAHSMIPEPVQIRRFSVFDPMVMTGATPNLKRYEYGVELDFVDPPGEINYYHLNFYQQVYRYVRAGTDTIKTNTLIYPVAFSGDNNNNVSESYLGGGILLEDNPYVGGFNFRLGVEIDPAAELLGKVLVELRTVSKEYYKYHQSINRQLSSGEGLGEPVIIYNNIENGHGIFAGYSSQQDSVVVPPIN